MSHAQYRDLFSAYLDGVLSPEEESSLQAHLQQCPECREELAQLRETVELLQSMPLVPLPDNFAMDLHRRLAGEAHVAAPASPASRKKGLGHHFAKSPWLSLAAAAAVILMVWSASQPPRLSTFQSDLAAAPAAQQEAATAEPAAGTVSSYGADAAAETGTADAEEADLAAAPAGKQGVTEKTTPAAQPRATENGAANDVASAPAAKAPVPNAAAEEAAPAAAALADPNEQGEATLAAAIVPAQPAAENAAEAAPAPMAKAAAADNNRMLISAPDAGPKIIRSAQLNLTVTGATGEEIAGKIGAVYPLKPVGGEADTRLGFQVQAADWDKAMIFLEELGDVTDLQFSENDISDDYAVAADHLAVLLEQSAALETMLAESISLTEQQDLEIQLHQLAGDTASLEEQLRYMDEKTAVIAVSLAIQAEAAESGE